MLPSRKSDPVIAHPNDAIVRVELASICGSDLHLYHGMMLDTRVGHTFGHEFIGWVEEVGPSVQNLKPGDRVMVPFNIYCGSCFFCARGLFSNCHNVNANATAIGGIYGYSHSTGGFDGGQAELVHSGPSRRRVSVVRAVGPGRRRWRHAADDPRRARGAAGSRRSPSGSVLPPPSS